jgi:hypothetical protein
MDKGGIERGRRKNKNNNAKMAKELNKRHLQGRKPQRPMIV